MIQALRQRRLCVTGVTGFYPGVVVKRAGIKVFVWFCQRADGAVPAKAPGHKECAAYYGFPGIEFVSPPSIAEFG